MKQFFTVLFFIYILSAQAVTEKLQPPDLSIYQYDKTKELVMFVYDAANLIKNNGTKALDEFSRKDSKWVRKDCNIFVYTIDGKCLINSGFKFIEGKNIEELKNNEGLNFMKNALSCLNYSNTETTWLHYMFPEKGYIFPIWKTSFIMKVSDSHGKEYIVGSGIFNMRKEKVFISDIVDRAAKYIQKNGLSKIQSFNNYSEGFVYDDVYLFIIDNEGYLILDPGLSFYYRDSNNYLMRNAMTFKDYTGTTIFTVLKKKLNIRDSTWIMYMTKDTKTGGPSKNLLYTRKVLINNKEYIIGSGLELINPIWMK